MTFRIMAPCAPTLRAALLTVGIGLISAPAFSCDRVVVGGSAEWRPISFRAEDGRLTGLAVDVSAAVFDRIGVAVTQSEPLPWKRLIRDSADTGEIDFIAGAYRTKEREALFAFAETPLLEEELRAFVSVERPIHVEEPADLIGYQGVRPLGGSYGEEFDAFMDSNLNVAEVANTFRMLEMVANNSVDYALFSYFDGKNWIEDFTLSEKIIPTKEPISINKVFFMLSQNSECLGILRKFDMDLSEFIGTNEFQELVSSYLD